MKMMNKREGIVLAGVKTTKVILEFKKHVDWLNQFWGVHIPLEYFEELIGGFSLEIFTRGVEVGKSEAEGK
jgi:hypothetical protein